MYSYHIALAIEEVIPGDIYKRQPLHCTIMHWFNTEIDESSVIEICTKLSQKTLPFELVVSGETLLGDNLDIQVWTVHRSLYLETLHALLLEQLQEVSFVPIRPQYIGDQYKPHITKPDTFYWLHACNLVRTDILYLARRTRTNSTVDTPGGSKIIESFQLNTKNHQL